MTVATATHVRAADLVAGDSFDFMGSLVTVTKVTPLEPSTLVEVEVFDTFLAVTRWLDHSASEIVQVVSGPSTVVAAPAPVQRPLATPLALAHVGGSRLRSLPTSAALVLFALAAVQDSGVDTPSTAQVAAGAGLAASTTQGHLRSLVQKGVVGARSLGWVVL